RFSLPQREHVTLKVFDVLGREVATLVDEGLNAGEHSVAYDAKGLPSGVYFYRLQGENLFNKRKWC
ncbi:MAG: T9SS type A sorting domain-containing protein, partial [Candidatus Kryptoniota bacterium]